MKLPDIGEEDMASLEFFNSLSYKHIYPHLTKFSTLDPPKIKFKPYLFEKWFNTLLSLILLRLSQTKH